MYEQQDQHARAMGWIMVMNHSRAVAANINHPRVVAWALSHNHSRAVAAGRA